jgi:acetylornithine deacetylase
MPSETLPAAAAEIEAAVERAVEGTGVRAEVRYPAGRDHELGGLPADTDPDTPAVGALRAAVRAVAAPRDVLGGAPFWSEMSFLAALGIPCVYWAPGDITNCHTSEERVELDEFLDAVKALSLFLAAHCGAGPIEEGDQP